MAHIAPEIFKAYDIRGIVGTTLTDDAAALIGRALAAEARALGVDTVALGRDGRLSGARLAQILAAEFVAAGVNVCDLGMVATPMLYFAAHTRCGGSGVMITGSHNPPQYNGFKIMLAGETLSGERIQDLLRRIMRDDFAEKNLSGSLQNLDIEADYIQYITDHIRLQRPLTIAIDAGNGVAGAFAGKLYTALGCTVHELFCEVDGTFPNHHPDPAKPENLQDLIRCLQTGDAEIGLAFDGDGDRLGVVTKDGEIIYPDRQLMLFAADVLARNVGAKVIYDVKCTRLLRDWISDHGGEPILSKTGHSFIKAAMKTHGAALAGEMSGHVFFGERWFGFDDGMYAGARLLEIVAAHADANAPLKALPNALSTPEINIPMQKEGENHALIAKLQQEARFPEARDIITLDGLRVEYADGFGLIRASNTTPVLVLRFEADNAAALARIRADFVAVLQAAGVAADFAA
ncbi:MAG: phosphomannomutase/phosphoglucomutase [Neisseria sp.]|nr:phosphomannomutase/phosphoglucomutase [Neisseria sp.]